MSKIKVNEIEAQSGSTITIPTGQTLTVTDGIPATNLSGTIADARLPTVPVSKGGTGLTSLGSAGQSIKVNSGGNGLEFGTISSDYVKIGSHTTSGNQSSVSLDIFTDTYRNYEVFINDMASSAGDQPYLRFRTASGDLTGNAYTSGWGHPYRSSGADGDDNHSQWGDAYFRLAHNGISDSTTHKGQYRIFFPNPRSTSSYKSMLMHTVNFNPSETQLDPYIGSGMHVGSATTALTGFTLYMSGGYIDNGAIITYYGIKG